jgi:hypothetical protein
MGTVSVRVMGIFLQGTKTHLCCEVALLGEPGAGALAAFITEQIRGAKELEKVQPDALLSNSSQR